MKRPILYLLVPFALGIVSSALFKASPAYTFSLTALFLLVSILSIKKNLLSHTALYIAVFLFGILYYQNSIILPGDHISRFASDTPVKVSLQGVISDDPIVSFTSYHKSKTSFVLNVDSVKEGGSWRESRGLIDVGLYARVKEPLHFGQKIIIEGIISKPVGLKNPGLFDYTKYLAIKDIYARFRVKEGDAVEIVSDRISNPVKAVAYRLRNWMRTVMDKHFEAPYSGFIKAIMIGDRTDLRYSLNNDFIKTGTIHAIAISGLNVGLIAAIFLGALALFRLPKKISLVLVACIMILYTFIAGSSPPIVRAVIIFIVFVAGYLIDRESEMLNSLAFTAFIMLLASPKELFDPSFQLSFISIASMIIFMPKINSFLGIDMIKRNSFWGKSRLYILSAVSVSIAAWLGTWPIVAFYFNIISPVALIANLVVVPALFLLTAASFIFLLADILSEFLAGIVAHGISAFCGTIFTVNHFLAGFPFAYIRVAAPSPEFMIIYYAAISLIVMPPRVEFGKLKLRRAGMLILMLLFFNGLVWSDALAIKDGLLKITFLDVGQGDSALVELPGGENVLIDAGSGGDEESFDAARSVVAPYLWNKKINKLDAVIVTHFHEDHLGGIIYILENFKVDRVMDSGASCEKSVIFDKYQRAVKTKKIRHEIMREGDAINFNGGTIFVLNPEKNKEIADCNENSLVLKIHYRTFDALFCGDASGYALERMTDKYGNFLGSDIIKIPHHGGNVGSEAAVKNFFDASGAKIAVISVAKMNKYRAPSQKTLKALTDSNPIIYKTKDNGTVIVSVNKESYDAKPYLEDN
ncbi:MAG: DNA internalization-related competence protein ComEC/Rec2 [Candidatus Omnitrophica bacterium]|nr:DNA internalization-related competence protein ComEC/Rec2 [Candidatus Omnitrophota bacterium]